MTLVLRSGWAAVPFLKGYTRVVALTDEERNRLAGLLFSRTLIDAVFRLCRDPKTAPSTAKRLGAIRRESQQKADDLLAVLPARPPRRQIGRPLGPWPPADAEERNDP